MLDWLTIKVFADTDAYQLLEPMGGQTSINTSGAQTFAYLEIVYKTALTITVALAVLMIVIGGVQYTLNWASPSAKGEAKDKIVAAIGGLILALASYLILSTINSSFVNPSLNLERTASSGGGGGRGGGGSGGGGPGGGTLSDQLARGALRDAGVGVKASANLNGVRPQALTAVISVHDNCDTCTIIVTEGTGGTHDPNAGHYQGYKLDVRLNPGLENHIRANFTSMERSRERNYERFKDPNTGAVWMLESNHWDVDSNP